MNGYSLKNYLPSYWMEIFQDYDVLQSYLYSCELLDRNRQYDYDAFLASVDPSSMAWKKTVPWVPIRLSFNRNTNFKYLTFGSGALYGGGEVYGGTRKQCYWILPDGMLSPGLVLSSPNNPQKTFFRDIDFNVQELENGVRILLLPITLFDELNNVQDKDGDRTVVLWAKQSTWINQFYFDNNELALGVTANRNEHGARVIASLYDAYARGPSISAFYSLLSGLFEAPICLKKGIVEAISDTKVVIGDIAYSRPKATHTLSVAVGDTVSFGQSIIEEFKVFFGPAITNCGSLTLTTIPGSSEVFDVTVDNTPGLPVVYGVDDEGYSKVRLPSSGSTLTAFWDALHILAKSGGTTLGQFLTGDSNPVVNPALLSEIKSLDFLANYTLSRTYVIQVDPEVVNLDNARTYISKIEDLSGLGTSVLIKVTT